MASTWMVRFLVLMLFVGIARSLPQLGWLLVAGALAVVAGKLLYHAHMLPRFLMDALDRLTNRAALEERLRQAKAGGPTLIDAEELAAYLKSRVIGQDQVADDVARQIRRRLAARMRDKPIAVFCFAGPPGVGKTYFAKVLAEKLYGDAKAMLFFDMSQFGQPHAAASLFGQAKGYVGSDSYGSLTKALRDTPSAVVLLDEFEKAHSEVHKRFLTAWNDGFVTEASDGARVSTTGAVFILTTNAAAKEIGALAVRHGDDLDQLQHAARQALGEAGFAPEVLSRIDQVFSFRNLEGLDVARVVALEIERLARQYEIEIAGQGIDPEILIAAIERVERFGGLGGVREVARAIERQVTDSLIDAKAAGAVRVSLRVDGQGKVQAVAEAAPPSASAVQAPV